MRKNAYDAGYEIVWIGHCKANLQKIPDLPIVEFYKVKCSDEISGKKKFYWNVRPLCITDEKIDATLPPDWRDRCYMGFRKFHELEQWLRS